MAKSLTSGAASVRKSTPADFDARASFTIDIELWDAPTQLDRQVRVQKIVEYVEAAGGEILSRYVGTVGLIVLRARMRGSVLRDLLELPVISQIDVPPIPDLGERDPPVVTIEGVVAPSPPAEAPLIGIVDSGSTDHPLLSPSLASSLGVRRDQPSGQRIRSDRSEHRAFDGIFALALGIDVLPMSVGAVKDGQAALRLTTRDNLVSHCFYLLFT